MIVKNLIKTACSLPTSVFMYFLTHQILRQMFLRMRKKCTSKFIFFNQSKRCYLLVFFANVSLSIRVSASCNILRLRGACLIYYFRGIWILVPYLCLTLSVKNTELSQNNTLYRYLHYKYIDIKVISSVIYQYSKTNILCQTRLVSFLHWDHITMNVISGRSILCLLECIL